MDDPATPVIVARSASPHVAEWIHQFGVLDHVVRLPSGEAVYHPMRVVPGGSPGSTDDDGCEVVFAVRRRHGMSDEQFEADIAAVAADVATLRRLIEAQRQAEQ